MLLKKMFEPGVGFPTTREDAISYTKELRGGIRFWVLIDSVAIPLALLLWATVMPTKAFVLILALALGCPIIMILGYAYGSLQHLSWREFFQILKEK